MRIEQKNSVFILNRILFSIILISFSIGNITGQININNYSKIDILDGLPQNSVQCIYQDSIGFLWFGTTDGLSRYDGKNFTSFLCDINDPKTISNNVIMKICEDKNNNLYIATEDGLNIYQRKTKIFERIFKDTTEENTLSSNTIYALTLDKNNRLWLGTTKGISVYDIEKKSFLNLDKLFHKKTALSHSRILSLFCDSEGVVWIGTFKNSLYKFDAFNNIVDSFLIAPNDQHSFLNNTILDINEDNNSNILLATKNGIAFYNKTNTEIKRHLHTNNPNLVNSKSFYSIQKINAYTFIVSSRNSELFIYDAIKKTFNSIDWSRKEKNVNLSFISAFKDKSGVLWLGTVTNGLIKINLNQKPFKWLSHKNKPHTGLLGNDISEILEDHKGQIWIGTEKGLTVWNREKNVFNNFEKHPDKNNTNWDNNILSLFNDSKKRIWIGTSKGVDMYDSDTKSFEHYETNYTDSTQIVDNEIFSICEDKNGKLWFATAGGLSCLNEQEKKFTNYLHSSSDSSSIPSNIIWEIYIDRNDNLWVATFKGLAKYIKETNNFKRYSISNKIDENESQQEILAITEDSDGNIWLGTAMLGIVSFNPKTEDTKHFPILKHFGSNIVYSIQNFKNYIWFSSGKGLGRLNKNTGEIVAFNNNDGIQSNEFNTPSIISSDSLLLFGGTNGITYFNPDDINVDNYTPPIVFTSLKVNFKEIMPGEDFNNNIPLNENVNSAKEIRLKYNHNVFSITFASLDYKINKKVQYAYKIEGINKEWIDLGNQNTVNFTGLAPGKYELMVKATNSDGVWNPNIKSLAIIITPPWWRTTWFFFILLVTIFGFAIYIIKLRESRIRKKQERLELMVNERTQEIEKQKEEIGKQKELIEKQNKKLKNHNEKLEEEIDKRLADYIVARDRAEEADRLKSAFLSNMSHELRTPLNAIIGFSELLSEHEISKDDQIKFLEIIKQNSNDLLNLFEKLIDISVLHSKKIELIKENIYPNKILDEIYVNYHKKISSIEKDLKLKHNKDILLENFHFYNDRARLKQVISYLMNNAIKYTEQGNIEFGCHKKDSEMLFYVKDTGVGIPANKITSLFNHFGKLEHENEKLYRGTGLGLTISKELVNLMGGKIWVESEVNRGSSFYFTLPLYQN